MSIRSKSALALLAFALSCSPMLAQSDDPPGPPPAEQPNPGGFGGRNHMGPMGRMDGQDGRGGWDRGGMHGRWGRGGPMGMPGRDGEGRGFALSRILSDPEIRQQVGVTAEQVAKIRHQESDFRKEEIRNRADLEVKRIELNDLLAADKPDRAAIDSKLQEISAAQLAMEKSRVDNRLNMRDALTQAQRDKLRDLLRQRGEGRGGPRPPGPGGARRGGPRGAAPPPPAGTQGQAPPQNH